MRISQIEQSEKECEKYILKKTFDIFINTQEISGLEKIIDFSSVLLRD